MWCPDPAKRGQAGSAHTLLPGATIRGQRLPFSERDVVLRERRGSSATSLPLSPSPLTLPLTHPPSPPLPTSPTAHTQAPPSPSFPDLADPLTFPRALRTTHSPEPSGYPWAAPMCSFAGTLGKARGTPWGPTVRGTSAPAHTPPRASSPTSSGSRDDMDP